MTDNPTRVLNALLALTDDPDTIYLAVTHGHAEIVLERVSLSLSFTSQAALDKLAEVTAEAAAVHRTRNLRKVA